MLSNLLKRLPSSFQACLGLWLTDYFSTYYDVAFYDCEIHRLLSELNIEAETYAPFPGFDYCDNTVEYWPVLILQNKRWLPVQLPNPLYESPDKTQVDVVSTPAPEPIILTLRTEVHQTPT
jgi:hypothetical protein